jgi:titin
VGANSLTIGGNRASAGNVISANAGSGIEIMSGATGTVVRANLIGTDGTKNPVLGNGLDGVRIAGSGSVIGGPLNAYGNAIADNEKGVVVTLDTAVSNLIQANSIFQNGSGIFWRGIDLGDDGFTPNSPGGPHTGPNLLQNFPVLTSAVTASGNMTVAGSLNSAPNATFTIELFASPVCGSSQLAQATVSLGRFGVTTDGSGNANFSFSVLGGQGAGITATATDASNNTSEISPCIDAQ